jgi:hypothetical protein
MQMITFNYHEADMAQKKAPTQKNVPAKKKTARKTIAVKNGVNKKGAAPKKESGIISFEGILEKRDKIGGGHFIRVPSAVTKFFGTKGRVRVLGTMNGAQVDRALIPDGDGGHEIIVGTEVRKKTKAVEGKKVVVEIYRNPNPDDIDIPEELTEAINMEPEAIRKFGKMTPGMKRNMAYWVNSGKLPETRAKRAVEILRRIMNNYPFGGRKLE